MINVTKTFLPPQEEYQTILDRAWQSGWITNRGVLVKQLEAQLKTYLEVPYIIAMTNGTLPIQIAIKALNLSGEIITTPFSYVATTSSIVWEHCKPVFVDIDPEHLTIDETKIEQAITPQTTAILATHVFGNPCHVEAIQALADKYNLKVIYDAAHCFGIRYKGRSLFNFGDVSTCSFHATKVFHTGEGGAIFSGSEKLHNKLFYHHNFGHDGPEHFQGIGINAKMSELQAAMGLAVLPHMDTIFKSRKKVVDAYNEAFKDSPIKQLKLREGTEWNYSYYPVMFRDEEQLLRVQKALNAHQIFPRRYFYPSLNTLPYLETCSCPISELTARTILCLPLYHDLDPEDLDTIINCVKKSLQ